jgi:hypothetical protein
MFSLHSIMKNFTSKEIKVTSVNIAKSIATLMSTVFILNSPNSQAQEVHFKTKNDHFQLQLTAPEAPALNTIYRWNAVINSSQQLNQVNLTDIIISGGMAAHGHGLPTQPKALNLSHDTANQISFDIQGLKFQMWGEWNVKISISEDTDPLTVNFELIP